MTVLLPHDLPHPSASPFAQRQGAAGVVFGRRMGTEFIARARPPAAAQPLHATLAARLLAEAQVAPHALVQAVALHRRHGGRLEDILLAQGDVGEGPLYATMARHWGVQRGDPQSVPPDPRLIDLIGATACLREGILPWRSVGGETVVLTAHPGDFARHADRLTRTFGRVRMALAPARAIEAAVMAARGPRLARAAEVRVAEAESCRNFARGPLHLWIALGLALLTLMVWLSPLVLVEVLAGWALLTLALATGLKLAAVIVALRRPPPEGSPPIVARLPVVSVMVALYREATIAPRLVRRLERLDYPRDLLDVVLVVEQDDRITRDALARAGLPPWMRVAVVPHGPVRTKPRALNFALDLCRGSIIGVYDAEDAPEPDQVRRIVTRFHSRDERVACLQGVLDFYNPRSNWLARCFTMEYAGWFRVILPGIARLGLPVPLGGTTLFFRRKALERLGAWDAHNVTEDADLGMRLARHGMRTELIDTVTEEEANCRAYPWVKQRSRWIKGYMMTWLVHMRDPVLLWRQLGARQFLGFQVLFVATLSQFLLAPALWSFWVVPLGVAHPVADVLPRGLFLAVFGLFILTEAVNLTVGFLGMRATRHGMSPLWLLTLHAYFPLGALAAYKAAWELVARPFYWDKTSHGHFDSAAVAEPVQRVRCSPASMRSRVS
jgi:cellulose synthase/poly-beta-1,6-N-acetylglucosamine synthase-like glycosyltransferase